MSADLATVDRQRRDLVASVSHELRTPLAALVAVLENLDDGVIAPDPETVHVARAQAERLSDLVDDLLDLSRVDAGVVALDRGRPAGRAAPRGRRGRGEVGPGASQRGVTFDVRVEPPDLDGCTPTAPGCTSCWPTCSTTRPGTARPEAWSRVWAGRRRRHTRLEVADEGPGIAPQDRERVFERFGTLPDSSAAAPVSGSRSRAGSPTCTAGGSRSSTPCPGETGARFRVELPTPPATLHREEPPMTTPRRRPRRPVAARRHRRAPRAPARWSTTSSARSGSTAASRPRRWVLLACLAIGLFAGLTLPYTNLGLAATLVLVASGVLVLVLTRHRRSPFTWACAVLAFGFALVLVLRDAEWLAVLGLMVSRGAGHGRAHRRHERARDGARAMAWPLAGLRGMPWLGRTLRAFGGGNNTAAVTRTVVLSVLGVLVFGLLFASGDAIFGHWVGAVLPDVQDSLALRLFLMSRSEARCSRRRTSRSTRPTSSGPPYDARPSTASSGWRRCCSWTRCSCCSWRPRPRPSSAGTTTSSARPG